ncbi:MAG: orotate phosphoribosyltransferase [Brevinematia bacterium]
MVESGVLKFGEFITKSGRKTPFFINTGNYDSGFKLLTLGKYYARCIKENFGFEWDVLYGPAYKGIPLVAITSALLFSEYGVEKKFCFNRKEEKDHGEGGTLIGYKPESGESILIVEDVVTAGTSVRESVSLLKSIADVKVIGLVVSVDRMEKGKTERSALVELSEELKIKIASIVNLGDIISSLYKKEVDGKVLIDDEMMKRIEEYRKLYGAG